jgi:RNA polymerase sigma factor (sigma-70 family)
VTPQDIDPEVGKLIQSKARRLFFGVRPRAKDLEDVVQDLLVRLLTRSEKHPPIPGQEREWIGRLLWQIAANYYREAGVQKNKERRMVSGQTSILDEEQRGIHLESTFAQHEARKHLRIVPRSETEVANEAMDVAEVLKGLPSALREVAELLKSFTPTEVARRLGIPRTTIYSAIGRLREIFRRKNLQKSSKKLPTLRKRIG